MFTASQKRKENIAEYLLYMWQIEDIIRAYNLDIEQIKINVIDRYTNLDPSQRQELTEWYESLIEMMRSEGKDKLGHIQINANILSDIVALHQALLKDPRFPDYSAQFYRALPFIVELRSKAGEQKTGEIETCFNALYGLLMMRLQQKEISESTMNAISEISKFISTLARNFALDEQNKLFPNDN